MDGWMDGWVDGRMVGKAGLRIAYSNQKGCEPSPTLSGFFKDFGDMHAKSLLGGWMGGWIDRRSKSYYMSWIAYINQ